MAPDECRVMELAGLAAVLPLGLDSKPCKTGPSEADPKVNAVKYEFVGFREFEDRRMRNSFGDSGDETDERGSGPDLRNRCLFEGGDAENGPGLSRVIPCLRFWMLRSLSRSGADDSRMGGSLLIDKRGCAGVVSEPIGMLEGVA